MEAIQQLRDITGAGVMDCKRALDEAGGDVVRATAILRKSGISKAAKRAGRETRAGIVDCYIHNDRVGVIISLHSETDFVARSEPFRELVHEIAMQIAAMGADDADALLAQEYIKDPSITIQELIGRTIVRVGENIVLGEFYRIEI